MASQDVKIVRILLVGDRKSLLYLHLVCMTNELYEHGFKLLWRPVYCDGIHY